MFLIQYNMDIKYIGSSEAVKALVFYITNYIMKVTLPTHLGLQALIYAIKSNHKKYAHDHSVDMLAVKRSLLTKVINGLMARNKQSHQQVLAYLVGGGDSYTSPTFKTLYWGELDAYIAQFEQPDDLNVDDIAEDINMAPAFPLDEEHIVESSIREDNVNIDTTVDV